jgi:hypothetical protein
LTGPISLILMEIWHPLLGKKQTNDSGEIIQHLTKKSRLNALANNVI